MLDFVYRFSNKLQMVAETARSTDYLEIVQKAQTPELLNMY